MKLFLKEFKESAPESNSVGGLFHEPTDHRVKHSLRFPAHKTIVGFIVGWTHIDSSV